MRKICLHCNNPFYTIRETAQYCTPAHRTAAFRERKGNAHRQLPKYTICQREGCDNEIPTTAKATAIYCTNACRQKVWHDDPENKKRAKEKLQKKSERKRLREQVAKEKQSVEEFIEELMGE